MGADFLVCYGRQKNLRSGTQMLAFSWITLHSSLSWKTEFPSNYSILSKPGIHANGGDLMWYAGFVFQYNQLTPRDFQRCTMSEWELHTSPHQRVSMWVAPLLWPFCQPKKKTKQENIRKQRLDGHGTTDWFQIGKGVHQVCILSPCIFNLFAEYIMRNAGLEEAQAGVDCQEKYQ